MHRRLISILAGLLIALMLYGCSGVGPRVVHTSSLDYNVALQRADDEQMLLNLVRLRYRDRPFFLEVNTLATQFSISPTMGVIGAFGSPQIEQDALVSTGISVEEQPTVSYQPLQGEEFAKRLLSPIEMRTIVLLANSGWSIERILRLSAQRMNGLPNAPTAAGPTPQQEPEYQHFLRAAKLLRVLQQRDQLNFHFSQQDGQAYLSIAAQARQSGEFSELTNLLGLDATKSRYALSSRSFVSDGESLGLQLRSLIGIMSFISQSVNAPLADQQIGLVTSTTSKNGELFDWRQVTGALIEINSQASRPDTSAVAVNHRGSWFYIDDSDLESKSTFSLLGQLFALRVGQGDGPIPTLTIPVTR